MNSCITKRVFIRTINSNIQQLRRNYGTTHRKTKVIVELIDWKSFGAAVALALAVWPIWGHRLTRGLGEKMAVIGGKVANCDLFG